MIQVSLLKLNTCISVSWWAITRNNHRLVRVIYASLACFRNASVNAHSENETTTKGRMLLLLTPWVGIDDSPDDHKAGDLFNTCVQITAT